jgi:predicted MPP superfamily phosphohydrolase
MKPYIDVFKKLNAPLGVYSVTGNHDYGDYYPWETPEAKTQNFEDLKNTHQKLGWRLLMNEGVRIEKGGESFGIIGIENWSSHKRFPKYGKLQEAHSMVANEPFKILLSHDPSHWHAQVTPEFKDIDLQLSGHTHGMQFGVEIKGFKWSPVQYVYKEWAGLYSHGTQNLYVNRGYGFLGYPGRVGILPEITLLELV